MIAKNLELCVARNRRFGCGVEVLASVGVLGWAVRVFGFSDDFQSLVCLERRFLLDLGVIWMFCFGKDFGTNGLSECIQCFSPCSDGGFGESTWPVRVSTSLRGLTGLAGEPTHTVQLGRL